MEKFKKENLVEVEPIVTSKVILEFFRHGKKEKDPNKQGNLRRSSITEADYFLGGACALTNINYSIVTFI